MTDSQCVDYLENICKMFVNGSKNCEHYEKVADILKNENSSEAERPKGEWTDLSTDGRHIGWIACSVCGQEPPSESNLATDFCPNCGADMRGDAK